MKRILYRFYELENPCCAHMVRAISKGEVKHPSGSRKELVIGNTQAMSSCPWCKANIDSLFTLKEEVVDENRSAIRDRKGYVEAVEMDLLLG